MFRQVLPAILLLAFPFLALSQVPTSGLVPSHQTTGGASLRIWSANDLYVLPLKTDQYYTAGMGAIFTRYQTEGPDGEATRRYKSWGARQDIFTPRDITSPALLEDDRPFASYAVVEHHRGRTLGGGWALDQGFSAGVLGKYSGGGLMQNAVHRMVDFAEELSGWQYEVKPDAILNYRGEIAKRWSLPSGFSLAGAGAARLGSLHTDASLEAAAAWKVASARGARHFRIAVSGGGRLVGYNATLSGGLINRDDRYRGVVRPERLVGNLTATTEARYGPIGLEASLVHVSPEFKGGVSHVYATAGATLYW